MKIKSVERGGASLFATGKTGHVQYKDSAMATGNGRGFPQVKRGVASKLREGVGNFLPVKIITTKHVFSSFEYLMSKVMRILKRSRNTGMPRERMKQWGVRERHRHREGLFERWPSLISW